MRRMSKKTAARFAECKPFRSALVAETGHCEICGHGLSRVKRGDVAWQMMEHHIARGIHREKALGKRYAVLVLCYRCHIERVHGNEYWPEARQLGALRRSRPQDYDLPAYNALIGWGPNRITEEDVDQWHYRQST